MLSILRALNPGYVAPSAKNTMSQDKASSGECSLPSELLGAVFSYLTLRELLQCRHARCVPAPLSILESDKK